VTNPIASPLFARLRFRPTLWPTVAFVILVATTVSLGNWQRHRAAEKEALREQLERSGREPVIELHAASADSAGLRYRSVRAAGAFDARRQMLIDNKVHAGRAGFDVVTPFKLTNGEYVLVDRGWIAQLATRADLPEARPPSGNVIVEGRINLPPSRYLELAAEKGEGSVWQNLDIARIAKATGLPLPPFIIEQTGDAQDGLVRDWPAPDFGVERHESYMVQWYSLALLGCVLWLALSWRILSGNDE